MNSILNKIWGLLTSNRFTSFYWRMGMMTLAGFTALIAENVSSLDINAQITVVLGLIFGEISKHIYNQLNGK